MFDGRGSMAVGAIDLLKTTFRNPGLFCVEHL